MTSTTFVDNETIIIADWLNDVNNAVYNATMPAGFTLGITYGGTGATTAAGARTNLGLGTLATQNGTFSGVSSGTNTGDQNVFPNITVGSDTIVADTINDTLTLVASTGIVLSADVLTDTITISTNVTGHPAGSVGAIQYNLDNVNFGGINNITTDGTNLTFASGTISAPNSNATFGALNILTNNVYNTAADGYTFLTYKGNGGVVIGPDTATGTTPGSLGFLDVHSSSDFKVTLTGPTGLVANTTLGLQAVNGTVYSSNGTDVAVADGGTGASTASAARTNLGLGTIATQDSNNVSITGGSISGISVLTVPTGGTGVTSMTTAYAPICAGTTPTGSVQVASTGLSTSGFVLTSNGASAVPSFQSITGSVSVITQVFTSSGTYTPTTNMKYCVVTSTGGGGGGGGAASTDAASMAAGGGGGAGGTCIEAFSAATIGASQTVTIGAAGTAGADTGATGGTGGTTTFGALHSAVGGTGGAGQATSSYAANLGGAGGVATGGAMNITGGNGFTGFAFDTTTYTYGITGFGGGSVWGTGADQVNQFGTTGTGSGSATGKTPATNTYGAGGSGGISRDQNSSNGAAGGAGAKGVVIVVEYI